MAEFKNYNYIGQTVDRPNKGNNALSDRTNYKTKTIAVRKRMDVIKINQDLRRNELSSRPTCDKKPFWVDVGGRIRHFKCKVRDHMRCEKLKQNSGQMVSEIPIFSGIWGSTELRKQKPKVCFNCLKFGHVMRFCPHKCEE